MDKVESVVSDFLTFLSNTQQELSVAFRYYWKVFMGYVGQAKTMGLEHYSSAENAFSKWATDVLDAQFIDHRGVDMNRVFLILFCVVLSLVAIIFISCCYCCCCGGKKRKSSKKTVSFLGLSNSGKTSLLLRMVHKTECEARMSQEENDVPFVEVTESSSERSVGIRVVDVPGNERVRTNWSKYASESDVVVFFINSVDFIAQSRQAAEYLYDVLTLPQMQKNNTPVIIFCNKCDLDTAKPIKTIRSGLEEQMEQLIQASAIDADTRLSPVVDDGDESKGFSFDNTVCPVSFISGSARKGDYSELVDTILLL